MKISFIDDEPEIYPLQYGGKARTIISLAKHLAKREDIDEVSILSRSIRNKKSSFVWQGIKFHKLDGYGMVRQIVDEANRVDILNVHTASFTFPRLDNCKAALVNHLHDVIFATSDAGSHLDKAIGGGWDAIVAPSDFAANVLRNITNWGDLRRKISIIPRGLDDSVFHQVPKDKAFREISRLGYSQINKGRNPIVFFPHRVRAQKGESYLTELSSLLSKKYPDILFLATFDGEFPGVPNLINLNWVATDQMKYFYSVSDLTISLSLLPESFSQICIESIACSSPVLCLGFGNPAYLSQEFPAIKSSEPDLKKIYADIIGILENKESNHRAILDSQRILTTKYNYEKIVGEYMSLYRKLILDKSARKTEKTGFPNKYFVSPLVAVYGSVIYLAQNGLLQKIELGEREGEIIAACHEAQSLNEIAEKTHLEEGDLNRIIESMLQKNILIKG